jgi:hypothetical protein
MHAALHFGQGRHQAATLRETGRPVLEQEHDGGQDGRETTGAAMQHARLHTAAIYKHE